MLQEIAGYVADQALELPLYSLNTIVGVNKRVKDLKCLATSASASWNTSVD